MATSIQVDGISFPTDYIPVPVVLGDTPVIQISATSKYALISLPDGTRTTVLHSQLHR